MDKLSKKGINDLIRRYMIEVVVLVLVIVVSYSAIASSNLSASALIAASSTSEKNDIQIMYGKDADDIEAILSNENILDRGTLQIKNTNNIKIDIEVILKISSDTDIHLDYYQMMIEDEEIDLNNAKRTEEGYELLIDKSTLSGYETYKKSIKLLGDPLLLDKLVYTFQVIEIYYE